MHNYDEFGLVRTTLSDVIKDEEKEFHELYQSMCKMAEQSGKETHIDISRRCGRQSVGSNVSVDSPESFWRCSVFISFLDHVINELNAKFTALSLAAVRGLMSLPQKASSSNKAKTNEDLQPGYKEDLPTPDTLPQEPRVSKLKWTASAEQSGSDPETRADTLADIAELEVMCHNITQVFH